MIEFHNVTKRFGKHTALQDVSFALQSGTSVALLGPNASGKTTLLKCLLGLIHPDAGAITVGGIPITQSPTYRQRIGYMPQHPHFPDNLRAAEVIELVKRVRGLSGPVETPYIERFQLESELAKPIRALSGGTRQKLSAVLAFMAETDILVLDEPTASLDPLALRALKDELHRRRASGCTIMMTTHTLADVPELSDEIFFLFEGRIALHERVADLLATAQGNRFDEALIGRLRQRL